MKIFLYYSEILNLQQRFKIQLIDCACQCFGIEKGNVTTCELKSINKLYIKTEAYDYFCVVEDSLHDFNDKKSFFDKLLNALITRTVGQSVFGDSIVTHSFIKDEFERHIYHQDNENVESEFDYKTRSLTYTPVEPNYTFDRVILEDNTINKIIEAINMIQYEKKVFDEWGLRAIQPNPSSALSFFGPSGTGKTMAAEAVASYLGKKILKVGYADIESKYHGEGPKMVKAIFLAAQNNDCVLFIDEADSLLSKRLTNVTQGSEQAINSMRSQLLICLEEFKGVVIFATNLVSNYDKAFLTRLISIEFKRPTEELRKKIWTVHLYPTNGNGLSIPLTSDIDVGRLAKEYDFCGREIRKAVISACVKSAMNGKNVVDMHTIVQACEQIKEEISSLENSELPISLVKKIINEEKNNETSKEEPIKV